MILPCGSPLWVDIMPLDTPSWQTRYFFGNKVLWTPCSRKSAYLSSNRINAPTLASGIS